MINITAPVVNITINNPPSNLDPINVKIVEVKDEPTNRPTPTADLR